MQFTLLCSSHCCCTGERFTLLLCGDTGSHCCYAGIQVHTAAVQGKGSHCCHPRASSEGSPLCLSSNLTDADSAKAAAYILSDMQLFLFPLGRFDEEMREGLCVNLPECNRPQHCLLLSVPTTVLSPFSCTKAQSESLKPGQLSAFYFLHVQAF